MRPQPRRTQGISGGPSQASVGAYVLGMECLGSFNEPVTEAVYHCVYWGQGGGSL